MNKPYEACIQEYSEHGPTALWEATLAIIEGRYHTRKTYDTGFAGACAFDNASPYAPVSILVCPTDKPYLNFEHYALEAGPEAVGRFMQAVAKVARDAVLAFDTALLGEAVAKRDHYEAAFTAHEAAGGADKDGLSALVVEYVRESVVYGFALRDRHTGHSGYRVAFNNGTGATGMSQPHMHAQIVGGRYLGGIAVPDPASVYPASMLQKVAHSLIHHSIKGTN